MFCINCGSEILTNNKFCRSCGEHLPATLNLYADKKSRKLLQKIDKSRLVIVLFFAAVGLNLMARAIDFSHTLSLIPLILITSGILSLVILTFWRNKLLGDSNNEIEINNYPASVNTGKFLEEKQFVPILSVTENTTELIYVENIKRKSE